MKGHTCFHCKQWIDEGTAHDCWTTTVAALTRDLPDELREAWERLREAVEEFGEQRIYASHRSIMFARTASYAFVRPSSRRLELVVFLGRTLRSPLVKRSEATSRVKVAHFIDVRHRDEVEAPLTDWLREAYDVSEELGARPKAAPKPRAAKAGPAPPARRRIPRAKAR